MFNNWFRFRPGRAAGGLGVGAEGMALLQTQSLPLVDGGMSPRYMVRRSFAPLEGARVDLDRGVLAVDLRGNGSYLSGQLALQALAVNANKGG